MKLWNKRSFTTLVGVTLMAGLLAACSGGRHYAGFDNQMSDVDLTARQSKMVEMASKKLDLNDAQKQRLNTLADKLREQRAALMGKTDKKIDMRADVQSLVAGAAFDRVKAQALIEEKTMAIRGKSPEVIAAAAEFFDSLNPAQQQQVRELMQRRKSWRG